MSRVIKVIIVDDHIIFRDALKFILARSRETEVIAEASNGQEFLDIVGNYSPDIVLMDISMPVLNGIDTTREAIKRYPGMKIIALSMFSDELYYFRMLEAGVQGFVLKESGSEELLKAIRTVINGDNYFSNRILCNIIRDFATEENQDEDEEKKTVRLSKRESEVLGLICEGYSSLLNKTGAKSSVHLALFALKHRIMVE